MLETLDLHESPKTLIDARATYADQLFRNQSAMSLEGWNEVSLFNER